MRVAKEDKRMSWKKRAVALWCAAFLAADSICASAAAEDASDAGAQQQQRYDINIGAELLHTDTAWSAADGLSVYYGTYDGSPVRYRVLPESPDTQTPEEPSLLLDADRALMALPFDATPANGGTMTNVWPNSVLCGHLVRRYENSMDGTETKYLCFSTDEARAIALTALAESGDVFDSGVGQYIDYASSDHLFLLSAKEAMELYFGNAARVKEGNAGWWTRSAAKNPLFAGFVMSEKTAALMAALGIPLPDEAGSIPAANVDAGIIGLSPALNLKLSSVLLSSSTGRNKALALAEGAVNAGGGSEWKLTLRDPDKSVKISDGNCAETQADGTILVPYTYTDADSKNKVSQISVMITDKEYTADGARILYYGALQNIKNGSGAAASVSDAQSGTGTFALPKDLPAGYKLYLVAECVSDSQHSDYASEPAEIRFHSWTDWSTVKEPTTQEAGLRQRSCSLCGQTQQEEIAKLLTYSFLENQNGRYLQGKDGIYQVKVNAALAKFVNVQIDGKAVEASNYELGSEATSISFKKEFMQTLAPGEHSLTVNFTDGVALGIITVEELGEEPTEEHTEEPTEEPTEELTEESTEKATEAPQTEKPTEKTTEKTTEAPAANATAPGTGDENAIVPWLCLLCLSGMSVVLLARRRRKES